VHSAIGIDLPILESTAAGLERVLREVASAPDRHRARAESGIGFVREAHDGRRSAAALSGFLGS
jgi:hypothetical protein